MSADRTNAERAERAEAALLAYIAFTGDSIRANGADTWVGDLMCDLRHFAERLKFEFNEDAGCMNYEAEKAEDEPGEFHPSAKWYVEGRK